MNRPERKLPRLRSYDYALPGAYFVTICVADRMPRFGEIVGARVDLNAAGRMVQEQWRRLSDRFPHVKIDAHVVMPNHVHAILEINTSEIAGRESLSDIVGAFKSRTSRAYADGVRDAGWPPFERRLWQQSFYDHIVRDDHDLNRIRDYIANNPARWHEDREYNAWQSALQQRQ
ncbi:MAG: transposase [Thermomicrobiales bacterium]